MTPRLLPMLLVAASACCVAADGDRAQAARLRDDARALRAQAEDRLRAAEPVCYERFLVNRCLAEAKEARLETIRRARELEAEASRLELAERQREAAERSPAAPQQPEPASASDREVVPDAAAEAIRRARDAQAGRDAAAAQAKQREEDAEKARERAQVESDAARRAEAARRDRERYDERIRRREQERREN